MGEAQKAVIDIDPARELVLMGPGPPLSYKLKLIAQRKIARSVIGPSLRGSNTLLGLSARRIYIYIYIYIYIKQNRPIRGYSEGPLAVDKRPMRW